MGGGVQVSDFSALWRQRQRIEFKVILGVIVSLWLIWAVQVPVSKRQVKQSKTTTARGINRKKILPCLFLKPRSYKQWGNMSNSLPHTFSSCEQAQHTRNAQWHFRKWTDTLLNILKSLLALSARNVILSFSEALRGLVWVWVPVLLLLHYVTLSRYFMFPNLVFLWEKN